MGSQAAAGAVQLGFLQLLIASVLVLVAGLVSIALRLKLERQLLIAAVRTVVQLSLVGYVLKWVFRLETPAVIGAIGLVMVFVAGRAAVSRPSRTFSGITFRAFFTLILVGFATTVTVTGAVVGVEPWYKPQYAIPLLGMILGNSLNGLSLCIDSFLESMSERHREVEMQLALGATAWEAAREPLADAVRRGMIPTINSMMVVGIVSLPGMMTGQILEGADPLNAVKYQIIVMFMLATATALSSMLMAGFVFRKLFNSKHQLQLDLILERHDR